MEAFLMDVGIIGAGKMGVFFARHFIAGGHRVSLFDINPEIAKRASQETYSNYFENIEKSVRDADFVLVATPIKVTPRTIHEAARFMRPDSIICEISSIKRKSIQALLEVSEKGISPLSVHPMYGPDVKSVKDNTMVVVKVLDEVKERELASRIFKGARFIVTNVSLHDGCMAEVLSLPYFLNLAFARSLSKDHLELLREMAGSTFTVQMALAQSIVDESPELIESLINENNRSGDVLTKFIDETKYLRRLLRNKPERISKVCEILKHEMRRDPAYEKARKIRNKTISYLDQEYEESKL